MLLGFLLVESVDLVVCDGKLWMCLLGMLKCVDVVFCCVDVYYVDLLDLCVDFRFGVVGLVEVQYCGIVIVVNMLGSGILENLGLLCFLLQLFECLFDESLLLYIVLVYWGGIVSECLYLLVNVLLLLIKSIVSGEIFVGLIFLFV